MPTRSRQTVARAFATIGAVLLTAGSGSAFADDTNIKSAVPTSAHFPAFLTSPSHLVHPPRPAGAAAALAASAPATQPLAFDLTVPPSDSSRTDTPGEADRPTLVQGPDASSGNLDGRSRSLLGHIALRARSVANSVVDGSMSMIGVRYRWGGTSPASGLDCSGFVRYVFQDSLGLQLPRRAEEMAHTGQKVALSDLQPGDLVFFNTMRRTFSHVGIYLGDNRFIHSPRTGEHIRIDTLDDGYWEHRFTGARRVTAGVAPDDAPARMMPVSYTPDASNDDVGTAQPVRLRFTMPVVVRDTAPTAADAPSPAGTPTGT